MLKNEALPLKKAKPKIFYGYVIVLSAFIIQAVGWGVPSTFGVFFKSLQDTFGWSRATIAGASSVSSLVVGVFSIGVGILTDRFGPRIIMTICGILLGIGYLLMSQINTVWNLYLFYGLIIGIGSSATNVVLLATATRWFNKKRGMMSGIIKVGTGVGMLIMPILAGKLIAIYDWRLSYTIVAIIAIIFILPLAQLLKRDPAQMGQLPDGVVQTNTNNITRVAETGFSPRELFHTRQFWLMCVIFLTITFCTQPILVHIVRHSEDLGAATASAAGVLSTIGGVSILGRLAMGYASDRIGNKRATIICFAILISMLLWLQFASELWALYLFAAVYGFAHGGFFALMSPIVAEWFGTRSHGVNLGITTFSGMIGGAVSQVMAGYIFDTIGTYQPAFLILLAFAAIGLILTLLLKPFKSERVIKATTP